MPGSVTSPRAHLVRALEADLIGPFRRGLPGPGGGDGIDASEELELPPSRWYLTGFLAPEAGREEEPEAGEELGSGNDETEEDTGGSAPEAKKKNFLPASMGLTVFTPPGVTQIDVAVRYANYDKVNEEPPRTDRKRKIWKRVVVPEVVERVSLTDSTSEAKASPCATPAGCGSRGWSRSSGGSRESSMALALCRSFS